MDQDRRDAMLWAEEWRIKQRRKKILIAALAAVCIAAVAFAVNFISIKVSRTTFGSAEEMKEALQGRYETDYAEDIVIDGDTITLTYYNRSHYDLEYAEKYGYSDYDDSVYEDTVAEWDYRTGRIKCGWMSDYTVDQDGNLVYYGQVYKKTDAPKPTPIDPSELKIFEEDGEEAQGSGEEASDVPDMTEEEQEAEDAVQESQEETHDAAEDAGVEPLPETGNEV